MRVYKSVLRLLRPSHQTDKQTLEEPIDIINYIMSNTPPLYSSEEQLYSSEEQLYSSEKQL